MSREREIKFLVEGLTFQQVEAELYALLRDKVVGTMTGSYMDIYYPVDDKAFVRMRASRYIELTFKRNDKDTNEDREEHNLSFDKDQLPAVEAIGGGFTKDRHDSVPLMWSYVDLYTRDAEVAVMMNLEDPTKVYVEVEAEDVLVLAQLANSVSAYLGVNGATVHRVKNSFYDIYARKQGVLL